VWVDTSALKIQVQCARENSTVMAPADERFPGDYTDHTAIMRALVRSFPDTIIWGADAPAYTYICRRKQGENSWVDFRLTGSYEDEKAALDVLDDASRTRVANTNTLAFLFGT